MNIADLMILKQAASSVALENNWTKEQEEVYFWKSIQAIEKGLK